MGKLWTILTHLHSLAGPGVMLLYPLYASVQAMESPSKLDDEQWLAYWILYSFITLMEMLLESLIYWIPIWYDLKLLFIAWLVLPNFRGAAFIYDKFVREQLKKHGLINSSAINTIKKEISSSKDKSPSPSSSPKDKEKPKSSSSPLSLQRRTMKLTEKEGAYVKCSAPLELVVLLVLVLLSCFLIFLLHTNKDVSLICKLWHD